MEERKVLLEIVSECGGTSANCLCDSPKEQFQVALAIHGLLMDSMGIAMMLARINQMYDDPEFQEAIEKATVKLPDFNEILKH